MPYTPADIASVEAKFLLIAEPEACVQVTYVVNLTNGETTELTTGTLTGMDAADAAIAVLQAKIALSREAEVDAHPWRNRG